MVTIIFEQEIFFKKALACYLEAELPYPKKQRLLPWKPQNPLKEETKEDSRKWRYILFSGIEIINIFDMAIFPKAIHSFNTVPI